MVPAHRTSGRTGRRPRLLLAAGAALVVAGLPARSAAADLHGTRTVSPEGVSSLSNGSVVVTVRTDKTPPDEAVVVEVLPPGWGIPSWSWAGSGGPPFHTVLSGVTNKWAFLGAPTGQLSYAVQASNVVERSYPLGGEIVYVDGVANTRMPTGGDDRMPARDADHDGMPDDWETGYGLLPNDGSDGPLDHDGDGASNRDEFGAGTVPTNSASVLRLTAVELHEDGWSVSWSTAGGRTNRVEAAAGSNFPAHFTPRSDPIVIQGAGDTRTNWIDAGATPFASPWIYRVRVDP
jgi:hypothetical protein